MALRIDRSCPFHGWLFDEPKDLPSAADRNGG